MEINTVNTKHQQLANGYYSIGSGNETILVMGSCRSVPYMNYLNEWNKMNGNRFTINFIDPFNFNWNENDDRIDYDAKLLELESFIPLTDMFKRVDIFIHEFYNNGGLFNTNREKGKNIYQYAMQPSIDITIPNWNDNFIMYGDIVSFDLEIRKLAIADWNVTGKLSEYTISKIEEVKTTALNKFYDVCSKTSFPEFAEMFKNGYTKERWVWNPNHIAKAFTLAIFELINEKYLHLNYQHLPQEDMYANNYTYLTECDTEYTIQEERKPLKEYLF